MFLIEHDAVFIIIAIGGVLESPVSAVNGNGDRPEILPCRVCQRAGKTGVFDAKLACRIFGLGLVLGCGNVAWVFFRLGTVNGYVQCAVFAVICPTQILGNSAGTDVVGVLAVLIVPVCGFFRTAVICGKKAAVHCVRAFCQQPHDAGVKQISGGVGVGDDVFFCGIGHQFVQNFVNGGQHLRQGRRFPRRKLQEIHKLIPQENLIFGRDQFFFDAVLNQFLYALFDHMHSLLLCQIQFLDRCFTVAAVEQIQRVSAVGNVQGSTAFRPCICTPYCVTGFLDIK